MSQVWKYALEQYEQDLQIPLAGKVIHVGQQEGIPTIWVIVDPSQQTQTRRFYTCATGQPLPDPAAYHGTVQMPHGLVWHVMEVKP